MTNNAATDTALAALANVVVADDRSEMLTAARAIVSTIVNSEVALGDSAKAWGHRLFRMCYLDNADMNALIGDTKTVADWASLSASDAGRKVKGRMEVYFSNARTVAEAWNGLTEDARRDMLNGTSSIHYVAGQLRKAASDAKKAADKEAKRVKAEEAAAEADAAAKASASEPVTEGATVAVDAETAFAALLAFVADMSEDEANAFGPMLDRLNDAFGERVNALTDGGDVAVNG